MNLNLSKNEITTSLGIHLQKAGYTDGIIAKVCIALDGSGSMTNLYNNGTVQAIVNRALVIGEKFDDDGTINVFDFSNAGRERQLPDATQADFGTYMKNKRMIGGGTSYGPILQKIENFFYEASTTKGFFGFGKKKTVAAEGRDDLNDTYPVFCLFITDGESNTRAEDLTQIRKILKNRKDMFVQFVGIGSSRFSFLEELDKEFDNCGHAAVKSLNLISEEDLIRAFLPEQAKTILTKGV